MRKVSSLLKRKQAKAWRNAHPAKIKEYGEKFVENNFDDVEGYLSFLKRLK
jgi:hypothetical protein